MDFIHTDPKLAQILHTIVNGLLLIHPLQQLEIPMEFVNTDLTDIQP
jgi:hypothetical protein